MPERRGRRIPLALSRVGPQPTISVTRLLVISIVAAAAWAPAVASNEESVAVSGPAITTQILHADLDVPPLLVERSGGVRLRRGWNLLGTVKTTLRPHQNISLVTRFRIEHASGHSRLVTRELMAGIHLSGWTFTIGRGARSLGRGERGRLLLDENTAPFDRIEIRSDRMLTLPGPLDSCGEFGVVLLNGVLPFADELPEDPRYSSGDDPVERPNLLGMRFTWAPRPWVEIGLTRTAMYGGQGREAIDTFGEWWKLLTAESENRVDGVDDALNSEQFASVDAEVRFPWLSGQGPVDSVRYYIEYAGTDVYASWQGDDTPGFSPIALTDLGVLQGLAVKIGATELVFEHVRVHRDWYRHGEYAQGYTNDGIPLGHPIGSDSEGWFVRIERRASDLDWRGRLELSADEIGLHSGTPTRVRTLLARWERSLSGVGSATPAVFLDLGLRSVRDPLANDVRSVHIGLGLRFDELPKAFRVLAR